MNTFDYGHLYWFGEPPQTPPPKPYLLGWNPALSRFKPYGLPVKELATRSQADGEFAQEIRDMIPLVPAGIQRVLIAFGMAVIPVRDLTDVDWWVNWFGPNGTALEYISQTPEFLVCVAADIEKFDRLNQAIYWYLLQPMPSGPREIFAECYGATQGQCAIERHVKDMPIYFPNSFRFVQELVAKLCFTLP